VVHLLRARGGGLLGAVVCLAGAQACNAPSPLEVASVRDAAGAATEGGPSEAGEVWRDPSRGTPLGDAASAQGDAAPRPARCGAVCVDRATDSANCGTCGERCRPGEACADGRCVTARLACPRGTTDCAPMAMAPNCVETTSDPHHCGACGARCPAGLVCVSGVCARLRGGDPAARPATPRGHGPRPPRLTRHA
jgi:hypothetical protein